MYSSAATGGAEIGRSADTLEALAAPAISSKVVRDMVMHEDVAYSLGFCKPIGHFAFGSSDKALGTPGFGGFFGCADPDTGIGFVYVMKPLGVSRVERSTRTRPAAAAVSRCARGAPKDLRCLPPREPRWWHPGRVGLLIRLVELLVVLLPLTGVIVAAVKAITANRRRAEEPQDVDRARMPDAGDAAGTGNNHIAQWRSLRRVLEEHGRTDARWLEYELDVAKLLDFPLMTDMRDPLTIAFHKAKLRADFLRPVKAEDVLDDREAAAQYMAAVEDYVTAFNAAEAEAVRRRRGEFSRADQQRIARAQNLMRVASDAAAAQQERQRAYELARNELDGLVVLPSATQASIERGISGEIER